VARKQLILEKSKELFFLHGFNNVSIQDICSAIEYGRSAVYSIFASKEEIYGYVYVEAVKILADLINTLDITGQASQSAFVMLTDKVFLFYKEYRPYYMALFFFDSNHVACAKIPPYLIKGEYFVTYH
jgi:AcrR family transcriptional regulator